MVSSRAPLLFLCATAAVALVACSRREPKEQSPPAPTSSKSNEITTAKSAGAASADSAVGSTFEIGRGSDAQAVSIDASTVYYGVDNALFARALDGKPSATKILDLDGAPYRVLAVEAASVDWIEDTLAAGDDIRIHRTPRAGGASTVVGKYPQRPRGATIDATAFYVASGQAASAYVGEVDRIPRAGGASNTLASGPWLPTSIANDAELVYVGRRGGEGVSLVAVKKTGGAPVVLFSSSDDQCELLSLVVTARELWWVTDGTLRRMPKIGGVAPVDETFTDVVEVVGDDRDLYVATKTSIARLRANASSTFAANQGAPHALVLGTSHLCWSVGSTEPTVICAPRMP